MTAVLEDLPTAPSYGRLDDLEELAERCQAIAAEKKPFGFDVETGYDGESRRGASLHPEENHLVSFQLTNSLDWGRMVPLAFDSGENVDNRQAAALLWPLMHAVDDEGLPLMVAHGAIAELRWTSRWFLKNLWDHPLYGLQVRAAHGYFPVRSCTLLESYAEGKNKSNALKLMTLANFGHQMRELTEGEDSLLGHFLGRAPTDEEKESVRFGIFNQYDPEVISYACEDVVWCLRHHLERFEQARRSFIYKIEMATLPVVCDMADVGVAYDWNLLREKAIEVREFADRLLAEVIADFEELAGEKLPPSFNLNSGQQFADLLYNKCGMPVLHKTPGGAPSTDAKKALPGLANRYWQVAKYLGWKKLHDLRLKFLGIYETKYSWAADGRAHPILKQNGTITGRFSCEAPNYQQSPKAYHYELRDGTRFDFDFRDAIIATRPGSRSWWDIVLEEAGCTDLPEPEPLGYYMLGFDLSQVELRALAAEAGEDALLQAFLRGEDVHRLTAARMLGIALSEVTKDQRQDYGKRMNFAIGYGLTEVGMAQQTGKPLEECDQLFADFRKAYPKLKAYTEGVIRLSRRQGYLETKFGRRVVIWEYQNSSRKVQSSGERTAGNCVIQGPATGDYMKLAMVRAVKALKKAGLADRVRLVMNIHDALEFECRKDVPPALVVSVLRDAVIFPVRGPGVEWPPLVADWHMGRSWGQLREIHLEGGRIVLGKTEDCPRCKTVRAPAQPAEEPEPVSPVQEAPVAGPAAQAPSGPPRGVIVACSTVPTGAQVAELRDYLKSLPGGNPVELQFPGDVTVQVPFTCGLLPENEARVSALLGFRCMVHYELAESPDDDLADGLEV